MRDSQSHYYQQHQTNISHWSTDLWLKKYSWIGRLGVRSQDLDTHPCVDDLVALLNIRMDLWEQMNRSEQAVWGAYWGMVFRMNKPLKNKAWAKFQTIVQAIDNRQQKIQIIRQIATKQNQNKGRNMTANCPDQPDSKLVKQDQLGGREDQDKLPWED
jgi:hypothetical protein